MAEPSRSLGDLVERARHYGSVRVAVADAAQEVVIETLRDAEALGLVEPRLVDDPNAIAEACRNGKGSIESDSITPAPTEADAAAKAVELVRTGAADPVMRGHIHTDVLMHALLDEERGLRAPGKRASHLFVVEVLSHKKLLGITDAAINIAPDVTAKAEIIQNAIEVFALLGIERPKVAVLSAVETVNPAIASTIDAACLALMARRGQIHGAVVDGPLAFDNAISADAAKEKGIISEVAGDTDIVLVPDLVSGNILAKNLEYLAAAVAAGVVVGLQAPVVLTSRADPPAVRLASLALAALMHHFRPKTPIRRAPIESGFHCAPQPEHACCPITG